jgi:benzoyl-CoA reductase/2-hydroxyglutaryl-CoA dehydratase subunit BcrC/BadD/HgdB
MDKSTVIEIIQQKLDNLFARIVELKQSGKKIIFTQCDIVPYEVFAAHGFVVSKLPLWVMTALRNPESLLYKKAVEYCCLADVLIVPQYCNIIPHEVLQQLVVHTIPRYESFAEDAVINLHTILYSLLQPLGVEQEYPNDDNLQQVVLIYEEIRKIMRALTTMYAGAFTQRELQLLCDAAFTLEPEQSLQLLQKLYNTVQLFESGDESRKTALIYFDYRDWEILDQIHHCGVTIAEDDSCNGRRQFDISCHTSSPNLYYELLYAYSFKSWCPGMRMMHERCELIYKALPNYDIKLVIFIQSFLKSRNEHLQYLYEQCLLQGTDAVILEVDAIVEQFTQYITALKARHHFDITVDL